MPDDDNLIPRLDKYVRSLLDAAESAKDGDAISFAERAALLRAATNYLMVRNKLDPPSEGEDEAGIDRLSNQLRDAERNGTGRRRRAAH